MDVPTVSDLDDEHVQHRVPDVEEAGSPTRMRRLSSAPASLPRPCGVGA
jgi:hypothetical protein